MADTPAHFETPEDVWRGYDPNKLPLNIEVIKSWEEDGCWFEKLRFTGEIADGVPTRILAVRGGPIGGKNLPGLVHIHGGGQTLYPGWVKFWAKRGYACVTYDFCGKAYDRTEYTEWGPLETCNMPKAGDGYFVEPDVRASSWYHWVVACRRAISLLEQTPGVDRDRLGIFGISVGGTLCWMVAGCDSRVKAAAPIYGCGYNIDPRRPANEAGPPTRAHLIYRPLLSPEACAPYIRCPVLFLSATNDMHGRMPTAFEILGAVDAPVRQVFTPRYDHHVEPDQAKDLPLWMDWHLKGGAAFPESPKIEVKLDSRGVPVATVSPGKGDVRKVEVYYSLGDKVPGARFWRTVPAEKSGRGWKASAPVMDTWKSLSVFANVFYSSGVCLSSNLVYTIPGQLGKARATLKWSATVDEPRGPFSQWYFVPAYTDPNIDSTYLRAGEDASGRFVMLNPDAFGGGDINFYIGSHFPGDEQYEGKPGNALSFQVKGGFKDQLTVTIVQNDRLIGGKTFSAKVAVDAAKDGWQTLVLPLSAFKADDGAAAESWHGIDKINITGVTSNDNPPCFRNFRWVDEQKG